MASARRKIKIKNKKRSSPVGAKVALFHCAFVYSGGGERIVLEEARELKKRGYRVVVYAPTVCLDKCFPEMLESLDVKMFLPSFFDKLPLRNALRMLVTSLMAPILALNFRDVDIFIGANQPGVWVAFCMAKILKRPYLVYLNQPNRVVYPRPVDRVYGWYTTVKDFHLLYRILRIFRPIILYLDKFSIQFSDGIMTNGEYIGNIIENVYSRKVINNPAAAKTHRLENKPDSFNGRFKVNNITISKPYLLITNRHDPQKRFDYVIKAFSVVLKTYKRAQLVIPGPFTNHTKNLIRLVKRLKIENKVKFLKTVTENDLQKLYKNACVYCYPSPEEDFGLGPLEAGGWGVPTVAWNHAGPTVTVEDQVTGFLANPYNIDDYANKILRFLKNKPLRNKMGKDAYLRTKNKFSWKNHIDNLEENIKKLT